MLILISVGDAVADQWNCWFVLAQLPTRNSDIEDELTLADHLNDLDDIERYFHY